MTVRRRGRSWQADFQVEGTRYRETFDTEDQAVKWEADTKHAIKYGLELPRARNARTPGGGRLETLGALFSHVRASHWDRAKGSRATIKYADEVVKMLGRDRRVQDVTTVDLEDLCNAFHERGNSQGTINRKMASISKMLSCAVDYGVIDRKPKIPKGKELSSEIRGLNPKEEAALITTFRHLGLDDWACFVIFAIDSGFRLGEIMQVSWLNITDTTVTVWETKNDKPRTVYLTKRAMAALEEMYERHPNSQGPWKHFRKDGMLKTAQRNLWARVVNQVGLKVRIHDLRHTCASRLVKNGVDLRRVQQWMGHRDIQTTLRYAHLAPSDLDKCRAALEM